MAVILLTVFQMRFSVSNILNEITVAFGKNKALFETWK